MARCRTPRELGGSASRSGVACVALLLLWLLPLLTDASIVVVALLRRGAASRAACDDEPAAGISSLHALHKSGWAARSGHRFFLLWFCSLLGDRFVITNQNDERASTLTVRRIYLHLLAAQMIC